MFDGVFMALFGNLVLLGAGAPFLARRLIKRRELPRPGSRTPQVEREALQDRVAAVLLALGFAGCVISGLGNRPVVVSETNETQEAARQLELFVTAVGAAASCAARRGGQHPPHRARLLPALLASPRPKSQRLHPRRHPKGPRLRLS